MENLTRLQLSKLAKREKMVIEIFDMLNKNIPVVKIATKFDKSINKIYQITYGSTKLDKFIIEKHNLKFQTNRAPNSRKPKEVSDAENLKDYLEKEQRIINIFALLNDGVTMEEIAKQFNMTRQRISQIAKGESGVNSLIIKKHNLSYNKEKISRIKRMRKREEKLTNSPVDLLDEAIVVDIFRLVNEGVSLEFICDKFDLQEEKIYDVFYSEDYKKIRKKNKLRMLIGMNRKYNDEQIIELFNLRNKKFSYEEIKNKTGISKNMISQILYGRSYAHIVRKYNLKLNTRT